jgi:methionyl-tRNA formyltransferase
MRALLLGKHKRSAVRAFDHLVDRGVDVVGVVAPVDLGHAAEVQRLDLAAKRHGIPLITPEAVHAGIADARAGDVDLEDVDVVLSFLYWRRIRRPVIELGRLGCLNFHPAPLPAFRGLGGYNVALMERLPQWGASVHIVDEEFDTGDLVHVERFPIDPDAETALSLDIMTQEHLLAVFRRVIGLLLDGHPLPRLPQGPGRYVDRSEFEALRKVHPDDSPDLVARRIRAFWYPPHPGATVEIGGRIFTLVDERALQEVARANHAAGILA